MKNSEIYIQMGDVNVGLNVCWCIYEEEPETGITGGLYLSSIDEAWVTIVDGGLDGGELIQDLDASLFNVDKMRERIEKELETIKY